MGTNCACKQRMRSTNDLLPTDPLNLIKKNTLLFENALILELEVQNADVFIYYEKWNDV